MKRLTTDKPSNNTEAMLNYAYAKDGYVHLSYADGEEDVRLTEYLCRAAQEIGCEFATEENILNGDTCLECDCKVSILNVLAIQAAELRERLKKYEDAEEQGLFVRPPYKLGQEVWVISSGGKVCRGEITKIEENIYTEPTTWLTVEFDSDLVNRYEYSSRIDLMIDKVVFLTQEAAEKALEDACRKNT